MVPVSAPPGEGTLPHQVVLATAMENPEEETPGDTSGNAEKSVMVCRHWKSKGWCRLEASCKFLHPEHKRGSIPASKSAAGPKASSAAASGDKAQATSALSPESSAAA